jgi:membrane associated rhomboid family serine protease
MIPIRDSTPGQTFPFVNYALILTSIAVFVWQISVWDQLELVLEVYALIPGRFLTLGERTGFFSLDLYAPFVTSAVLHGSFGHVGFNLLFLWIFGDNVEDRFGHVGYACFYLLGAFAAGAVHVAANPASLIPTVGASGAIAAVMGAYFLLYPRAWVTSIVPPFFWIQFRVPALLYLAVWFGMQLYMGRSSLEAAGGSAGVAWWAHAGGFAFGLLAIVLLGRRRR